MSNFAFRCLMLLVLGVFVGSQVLVVSAFEAHVINVTADIMNVICFSERR